MTDQTRQLACGAIDCHFHIYPAHMDLARIGEDLDRFWAVTGIDTVGVACVPVGTHPGYDSRQLFAAFLMKALRPDRVFVLGALDYTVAGPLDRNPDLGAQAERLHAMGVDGVKMLEGKPTARRVLKTPQDAPVYDPFYRVLARHSLPILAHVADPPECWDPAKVPVHFRNAGYYYAAEPLPSFEGFRAEILNVARRHPDLKLILAHFFCAWGDVDQAARFMDEHPNIAFDLTPGFEMYTDFAKQPAAWRDFFIRYSARILFGTEGGFGGALKPAAAADLQAKIGFMRRFLETDQEVVYSYPGFTFRTIGLGLPPETCARIYSRNFLDRVPSRTPRPMDRALVVAECRRAAERLRSGPGRSPERDAEIAGLETIANLLT
jgi:predicted TIM-barrel fold metal-dependent hydrolase